MRIHRFSIDHPVLWFETPVCGNGALLCGMSCATPLTRGKKDGDDDNKKEVFLRDKFLYHAARIILGLIFLFACYDKLLHPQAFAKVVYNYQVLPDSLVNITAILLPWVELVLGLCLIFNVWIPGAAVLGNLLLLSFISMLIFNMARGLDVNCGCFSTAPGEKGADYLTVLRDLSFLVVSGCLFWAEFFSSASMPGTRKSSHR